MRGRITTLLNSQHLTRISLVTFLLASTMVSFFITVKAITWSVDDQQLTSNTHFDGFPALAQTKDGRVWFVWSKEVLGNLSLCHKISNDQGRTWSPEMNLTKLPASGNDQNPSIMQAQNETIWVVWTSDRPPPPAPPQPDFLIDATPQNVTVLRETSENSTITVTSLNDFNGTVDLSVLNEPTGVSTTFDPIAVAPPANGTVNSTLTISTDPSATPGNYTLNVMGVSGKLMHTINVYVEITAAGGTGQAATGFSEPSSLSNQATASIQDYEIYFKTSHDNGETWSADIQLTNNGVDDLRPAITQLNNGTIMIVWQSYTPDNHNIVCSTTIDGVSWSDIQLLTSDPARDKAPALTQTADGSIWVVWASMRHGDYEIYYKTYDGATWLPDQRLTYDTKSDVQPAIVQTVDEEIMIFWASSSDTGNYDIYYKLSSNNGATWSSRTEFVGTGYEDIWPAVMQAQDTKMWVAWYNNEAEQPNGNWDVYLRTSLAGDVNEDNQINVLDLTIVSLAYGSMIGEPDYNPVADINNDGIVEMRDLRIVAYYLGET